MGALPNGASQRGVSRYCQFVRVLRNEKTLFGGRLAVLTDDHCVSGTTERFQTRRFRVAPSVAPLDAASIRLIGCGTPCRAAVGTVHGDAQTSSGTLRRLNRRSGWRRHRVPRCPKRQCQDS